LQTKSSLGVDCSLSRPWTFDCLIAPSFYHTYSGPKTVATELELWYSEQAACDPTKGECNQLIPFENSVHRLRIGHTYLTLGYLLWGETPPQCLGLSSQIDSYAYLASVCIFYEC